MTVLCGGGTSSPKPGVASNVLFDVGLITQGLELISPWLLPFAALIDTFTYNAVSSCGTDPPPMPTFTAADALNLVGGILNPNLPVTLAKVNDALLNYAWSLLCQCNNGTVVPPPGTIGPPPGITVTGTGGDLPCFSGSVDFFPTLTGGGANASQQDDLTTTMLPTDGRKLTLTDAAGSYTVWGIPAGVDHVNYQVEYSGFVSCPTVPLQNMTLTYWNASGALLGHNDVNNGTFPGFTMTGSLNVATVTGASYYRLSAGRGPFGGGCGNPNGNTRCSMQTICGTAGAASGCCPPDPSLMNGLSYIMDVVKRIAFSYGTGPTSTVDGVTHSGLSGSGSLVLDPTAVGVRVTMTTLPTGVHVEPGNPTFYWDAGFITPLAASSPLRGWRLVFTPQSFLIPLIADSIGYTLLHGTVVDVTELLAAP